MSTEKYRIDFLPPARRAITEWLPETVAAAALEFCTSALATDPYRVGKPLSGRLAGCYSARRGSYRIVYQIDDRTATVHVVGIGHRANVYRPR